MRIRNLNGRPTRLRSGFSIVEVVVVSLMMTLLSSILYTVWTGFCRPARDAATRCRLATEANLAIFALSQDLSGDLIGVQTAPDISSGAEPGQLCLQLLSENSDGSTATLVYRLSGNRLVRDDKTSAIIVAGELLAETITESGFVLTPWSDGTGNQGVEITLTFASLELNGNYTTTDSNGNLVTHDLSLTYKIVAVQPTSF